MLYIIGLLLIAYLLFKLYLLICRYTLTSPSLFIFLFIPEARNVASIPVLSILSYFLIIYCFIHTNDVQHAQQHCFDT